MPSTWTEVAPASLRTGPRPPGDPLEPPPLGNEWEECEDTVRGSLRGGSRGRLSTDFTRGRGAGRMLDVTFPIPRPVSTLAVFDSAVIARQGTITGTPLQVGSTGTPIVAFEEYKGRAALKIDSDGLGVYDIQTGTSIRPRVNTTSGGPLYPGDFACWRIKAILAFEHAGSGDLGLELTPGTGGSTILTGTAAGFLLRPVADDLVRFYSRATAGGGLTASEDCPIILDTTEYNVYEFRLISATPDLPAYLRVLINGREQFLYDFDDVILPKGAPFCVRIVNRAAGKLWLPIGGVNISAAPTEASTR